MAQWQIVGQFTIEADTPDEAIAWLQAELARRLRPGQVGGPWQPYGAGAPSVALGSLVREVRADAGVPSRTGE